MLNSTATNQSRTKKINSTIDCSMDTQSSNKNDLSKKSKLKAMSYAFKKIQTYRDLLNSESARIMAIDLSCVVYLCKIGDKFVAKGYSGRSKKYSFYRAFKSIEARNSHVQEWMKTRVNATKSKKSNVRTLEKGDVLRASWGYEQTNVDYFLITGLIGKTMVEVVEIGAEIIETGSMTGNCIPDLNNIISEPMRRKATNSSVKINESVYASKMEPKIINGCKIYNSSSFSSYH